jgi:iron complex transport system substrate-binding protein
MGCQNRRIRYGGALFVLMFLFTMSAAPIRPAVARTFTDPLGRSVQVPNEPRRVVSLAPSITEIVFALGRESQLVGVTRFSDYPPAAGNLPKVGSYIHLDVERIAALRPDLCIGIKDGNPLTAIDQLQGLGIPVFAVDPRDLESVMHSIAVIGDLLNAAPRADAIVADMQARLDRVRRRVAQSRRRPRVFFQLAASPMVSVGGGTFIHDLIVKAGGSNVADGPNPYPRYSREQVIALAPEVIVISSMERAGGFDQVRTEWMQWPAIPAVARNAVFVAPSNLFDRPSPRLVEGLELLAGYIHPDLFEVRP